MLYLHSNLHHDSLCAPWTDPGETGMADYKKRHLLGCFILKTMPVGIRSISLAFFRPYRSGLLVPLNQTLEFPYWNHIWFVNQILLEKRFFMKPWGQEAVAPGLRLMVHQSSMNVSPAFRSASESFVAVKFSIFSSCKVFIFLIKFHSGNGTWRKLQMDCISKAVTCSDLS